MKNELINIILKLFYNRNIHSPEIDELLKTKFDKYINLSMTGFIHREWNQKRLDISIYYKYCDTTYLDKLFINCKRTDFYYIVDLKEILSFIDEELLTTFVIEHI